MSKYLKAAALIESGEENFVCTALVEVKQSTTKFKNFFEPTCFEKEKYSEGCGASWFGHCRNPKNQLARQIALNLIHEMNRKPRRKKRHK